MLETLICGDTQIPASDLRRALDRLGKMDKNFSNMTGFEKQFQVTLNVYLIVNNNVIIIVESISY